jgi:hypothetical protein
MDIDFYCSGNEVTAAVTIDVPVLGPRIWKFVLGHPDPTFAAFAQNAMAVQLRDALQNIRREAYEAGWKDAKARRRKATWFSRFWR